MSIEILLKSQSYCRKSKNLTKLGFDFENPNIEEEYYKIQSLLYTDYHILCESIPVIIKKYNIPSTKTLHDFFKIFEIETRNFTDALSIGFEKGRVNPTSHPKYKFCWHKTWDNKNVFLRSSYELDYAKELDNLKIRYDVECLRIKYFNKTKNRYCIAVPDFVLLDLNTIVEIKSQYSFDVEEMNNKFEAYQILGYETKLILDHKEYKGLGGTCTHGGLSTAD